jgi:UDP-GlcNAc:undecaprenyl-phosphate GlcNAc-1-phosphate transferase
MGGLLAFAAALAVALVCTPLARRASFALGILDRPGPLKVQREPVAYLGGVSVFAAVALVLAPWHPSWIVPLALAAALGVADDVRSISPRVRLAAQASIGCVAGAVAPAPGPAGWLLTAGFVVVLVNAVNLIDGMDGLAAVVVAVAACGFALVGGRPVVPALALCGALTGFFAFNRPPARIYLGDGGSYLLGTALALLAAAAMGEGSQVAAWIGLPLFVALPIGDTAIAVVRRWLHGRPLLEGDRSHVYDQLADRGWAVGRVLVTCAAIQAVAAAAALLARQLGAPAAAAVVAAALATAAAVVWKHGFVREKAST